MINRKTPFEVPEEKKYTEEDLFARVSNLLYAAGMPKFMCQDTAYKLDQIASCWINDEWETTNPTWGKNYTFKLIDDESCNLRKTRKDRRLQKELAYKTKTETTTVIDGNSKAEEIAKSKQRQCKNAEIRILLDNNGKAVLQSNGSRPYDTPETVDNQLEKAEEWEKSLTQKTETARHPEEVKVSEPFLTVETPTKDIARSKAVKQTNDALSSMKHVFTEEKVVNLGEYGTFKIEILAYSKSRISANSVDEAIKEAKNDLPNHITELNVKKEAAL